MVMEILLKEPTKIIEDMVLDFSRKQMVNIVKRIGKRINWSTLTQSKKKMPNKQKVLCTYYNKIHPIITIAQCLKMAKSLIVSEASYVYILSGQKFIKNGSFWQVFENLKRAVKQCSQTEQKLVENAKNLWPNKQLRR